LKVQAAEDKTVGGIFLPDTAKEKPLIAERVKELEFNVGCNVATDEFVDIFEAGVVDLAQVTLAVVQNAASIASMVLTTECIVSEKPEPKSATPAPAGAGMGGNFDS
jgi:chaperonin GroEL